jgi:glycosyltransferase involved in cell wall biosynthesis
MGKKVVLVMRYPYEAFRGGESTYIRALRGFLLGRGHDVTTIISDVVRSRRSPIVHFPDRQAGRWRIRRTFPYGKHRYLCLDARLPVRTAMARLGMALPDEDRSAETSWVGRIAAQEQPDAVILLFGATEYHHVVPRDVPTLALHGFFSSRYYKLEEPRPSCEELVPAALAAQFAGMPLVGLNNGAEAMALSKHRAPGSVIEVGVGFRMAPPAAPRPKAAPVALFVGARTEPNDASLEWLLEGVWPRIAEACPAARLRVVGSVCGAFAGRKYRNVDMVGIVPSIRNEYEGADIVLAPLIFGSAGVKTKVAEALSFRRPLVTTSLGVDFGKPDQYGEAVDVADDAASFAKAAIDLLSDPLLRSHRERLVVEAFQANFSDDAAYGEMARLLGL